MSVSLGTILTNGQYIDAITQDNSLERQFHDALVPELMYRAEAVPKEEALGEGETKVYNRRGKLTVDEEPDTPGSDPVPENESYEQWKVTFAQHSKSSDVNMLESAVAVQSLFLSKAHALGVNAGEKLDRLSRNKLFCAYLGGHTVAETATATTTFEVASINGFTEGVGPDGKVTTTSAAAPKSFRINGTLQTETVIGAVAIDPAFPLGRGTLTTSGNVTVAAGDAIDAEDAASIVRSGGGTSVDALTSTSVLTLADLRQAYKHLHRNGISRHPDGWYHAHVGDEGMVQLFADNEFQRVNEGQFKDDPYRDFLIGYTMGMKVYANPRSPDVDTTAATKQTSRPASAATARLASGINAEVINAGGTSIHRVIVTGRGSLYECYLDEAALMSQAGVQGKIGNFQIVNDGIQIGTERIRYIIRAPQDRKQQMVSQTYTWTGDFGIPSDVGGGLTAARFKRAVVIEHGS